MTHNSSSISFHFQGPSFKKTWVLWHTLCFLVARKRLENGVLLQMKDFVSSSDLSSWEKITFKRISYFVRAKLSMEIQKKGFKGSFLSFFDWNGKSQKKLLCDRPILPGNYFAVSHIYLLFLFVKLLSCLLCPYIVYLLQLLSPCLDPSGGVQKYFSIPKLQIFLLHFVSWKFGNMH